MDDLNLGGVVFRDYLGSLEDVHLLVLLGLELTL
jgi:hypothetical protein